MPRSPSAVLRSVHALCIVVEHASRRRPRRADHDGWPEPGADSAPAGWDKPFWIDVTNAVRTGRNHVAVRVLDRVLAGGIWQTVWLAAEK